MAKAEVIKRPVDKVSNSIKQSAWMAILESLATTALGIFLIAWPDTAVKIIAYIAGVFFIIKGGYQIISYFIAKGQNDFFNNNLLSGVISVLVGATVLIMSEDIANVFRIVVGIWMIYESLVRINTAIKLHSVSLDIWKYILILALCMLVVGVFIVFNSGAVMTLVGWMMVLTGIFGLISDIMFIQYVNELANKLAGEHDG